MAAYPTDPVVYWYEIFGDDNFTLPGRPVAVLCTTGGDLHWEDDSGVQHTDTLVADPTPYSYPTLRKVLSSNSIKGSIGYATKPPSTLMDGLVAYLKARTFREDWWFEIGEYATIDYFRDGDYPNSMIRITGDSGGVTNLPPNGSGNAVFYEPGGDPEPPFYIIVPVPSPIAPGFGQAPEDSTGEVTSGTFQKWYPDFLKGVTEKQFTFSCWYKRVDSFDPADTPLIKFYDVTASEDDLLGIYEGGANLVPTAPYMVINDSVGLNTATSGGAGLAEGTWHRITCWWDGPNSKCGIQVDNRAPVEVATNASTLYNPVTPTNYILSVFPFVASGANTRHYTDIGFWDRCLSAWERKELTDTDAQFPFHGDLPTWGVRRRSYTQAPEERSIGVYSHFPFTTNLNASHYATGRTGVAAVTASGGAAINAGSLKIIPGSYVETGKPILWENGMKFTDYILWYKRDTTGGNLAEIFCHVTDLGVEDFRVYDDFANHQLVIRAVRDDNSVISVHTYGSVLEGTWNFLRFGISINNNELFIQRNNDTVQTLTYAPRGAKDLFGLNHRFRIGNANAGRSNETFRVKYLTLFARNLTDAEVAIHYNNGTPLPYPFY